MVKLKIDKAQFDKVLDTLDKFAGKQAKTVFRNAFNRAGFTTRKMISENDMGQIFKNPNQYTRNSLYYQPLKYGDDGPVGGILGFKKKSAGKGVGAGIYLMPEEWGGSRMLKGLEHRLMERNLLPSGKFAVPTAKLDKRFKTAQGIRLIADLAAGSTLQRVGYRKGRVVKKTGQNEFFNVKEKRGKLEPGIYQRTGLSAVRVIAYVDKVEYKQIFHFYDRAIKYFTQLFKEKVKSELDRIKGGAG